MTDNTAVDRMGSLFNDFLAAAEAIKERPQLEAKVREAEANRDRADASARFMEERYNNLAADYDAIKAKLAVLEADLAQATFRETEVRNKLEAVVSVLKDTMSEAKAAVELVEPPAPVVEPTPEQAEVTIDVPFPYTTNTTSAQPSDRPTLSSGDGAGDATPTLSGITLDAPPVPAEAPAFKPYFDKPYWLKPDNLSWRDWTNGGGDRAPWVKETDAEWAETYHRGGLSDVV